jgi:hypothetical protein
MVSETKRPRDERTAPSGGTASDCARTIFGMLIFGSLMAGVILLDLEIRTLRDQIHRLELRQGCVANVAKGLRDMANQLDPESTPSVRPSVSEMPILTPQNTLDVSSSASDMPVLTLLENTPLPSGDKSFYLGRRNGKTRRIIMQADGNLVVYENESDSEKPIWATDTDKGVEAFRTFAWTRGRTRENPKDQYRFFLTRPHHDSGGSYDIVSTVEKLTSLASSLSDRVYDRFEVRYDGMYFLYSNSVSTHEERFVSF